MNHQRTIDEIIQSVRNHPKRDWPHVVRSLCGGQEDLEREALLVLELSEEISQCEARGIRAGPLHDGRYELVRELDRGGTATVWIAFDTKLARNVAIKIFEESDSPMRQVLDEAIAASDIISEHIVRILDVREDVYPAFLVMDLIGEYDDHTSEWLIGRSAGETRPSSQDEAIMWVIQAALGLRDAHRRNIFHRDMKPKNVLISPVSRRAFVIDFGLSVQQLKHKVDDRGTISMVIDSGVENLSVVGTLAFMAPEQARGLKSELNPWVPDDRAILSSLDVFGLGALAFELCTDQPPFPMSASTPYLELWEARCRMQTPNIRKLRGRFGKVPKRLAMIIQKAMAEDPSDRYSSPAALASAMQAYLKLRPTVDEKSNFLLRIWLWIRRHRSVAGTTLVSLALTVAIMASMSKLAQLEALKHLVESDLKVVEKQVEITNTELSGALSTIEGHQQNLRELQDQKSQAEQEAATALERLTQVRNKMDEELRDSAHRLQEVERSRAQAVAMEEKALQRAQAAQLEAASADHAARIALSRAREAASAARHARERQRDAELAQNRAQQKARDIEEQLVTAQTVLNDNIIRTWRAEKAVTKDGFMPEIYCSRLVDDALAEQSGLARSLSQGSWGKAAREGRGASCERKDKDEVISSMPLIDTL